MVYAGQLAPQADRLRSYSSIAGDNRPLKDEAANATQTRSSSSIVKKSLNNSSGQPLTGDHPNAEMLRPSSQ